MIRFMICDTDTDFLGKLAIALHHNFDPCSVEYMYGPSALEVSLRSDSGGADVLLTEIELRGYNAISIIAQYLKESSPLQIIYMTPKIEYCTEVYETRHCGFLLKPIRLERLVRDVQRALRLLEEKKAKGIVVQRGSSLHAPSLRPPYYCGHHRYYGLLSHGLAGHFLPARRRCHFTYFNRLKCRPWFLCSLCFSFTCRF